VHGEQGISFTEYIHSMTKLRSAVENLPRTRTLSATDIQTDRQKTHTEYIQYLQASRRARRQSGEQIDNGTNSETWAKRMNKIGWVKQVTSVPLLCGYLN
jgi:hypothetical protein